MLFFLYLWKDFTYQVETTCVDLSKPFLGGCILETAGRHVYVHLECG